MKNNPNGQATPDKSGSKSNQNIPEVAPKKVSSPYIQPVKKGKEHVELPDSEEQKEGTTSKESIVETTGEKAESKTAKQSGKGGNL